MSTEVSDSLYKALEKARPAISTVSLASRIGPQVDLPEAKLRGILAVLVSLTLTKNVHGWSAGKIAREVIDRAIQEKLKGTESLDTDAAESVSKRLSKLLSLERTVGITAKVADVVYRHAHPFHSAQIISDVRPVFSESDDLEPIAAVVMHNLELVSHDPDNTDRSYFIALDSHDLRELKNVVDRALKKEEKLDPLIEASGLSRLD